MGAGEEFGGVEVGCCGALLFEAEAHVGEFGGEGGGVRA